MSAARLRERYLSRGPLDLLIQLLVIAAAYTAWRYARGAVAPSSLDSAFANARDLVSLERSLHTLVEIDIQRWALDAGWPAEVARWGYANLHFKGSCLALAVTYFCFRGSFGFVRNAVLAAMVLSVISYALYPTAPPRFLTELGLDGATSVTGNNPLMSDPGNPFFNPVAAVPSMHAGLATIFAVSLGLLVRPLWLKAALFAYPLLMTYVVVATGNHYWVDALFGAMTAAAAAGVAVLLGRLNPDWAFRGGPDGKSEVGAVEPEVGAATA
ncbi:MAG: phosphatase PAP2 family protein [Actinomycetota bacterium]|nr:phosphatase PAP2 family protein [Actinomycetota bacterium]